MKHGVLWTPDEDERLVALWRDGYEAAEIAAKMDRTKRGVDHRIAYLRRHNVTIKRRTINGRTLRKIESRSCHPFIRFLVKEMHRQQATWPDLAKRCGVDQDCMENWLQRTTPRLANIEAALNALGYELKITPIKEPTLSTGDLTQEPLRNAA